MNSPVIPGLIGYGKMGQRVAALAASSGFGTPVIFEDLQAPDPVRLAPETLRGVQVCIDFSHPAAVKAHAEAVLKAGIPLVIGTTGWYDTSGWIEALCRDTGGRAVYGSNFSIGVQLFFKLAARAGSLFQPPVFHASVHELHHIQKADAPSGTGKTLGREFLKGAGRPLSRLDTSLPHDKAPDPDRLYVTAERNASIIGEHRLRIGSEFDDIEIVHRARNRDAFARGALQAARWILSAPAGFYLLEDIIEEVAAV